MNAELRPGQGLEDLLEGTEAAGIKLLRENVPFVITVVIIAGAWLALRTTATKFGPDSSFDALLAEGEPVVVEFFGNT